MLADAQFDRRSTNDIQIIYKEIKENYEAKFMLREVMKDGAMKKWV